MASLLFYKGMDSVSVSARLGHAQVSTTSNIYAHVMGRLIRKAPASWLMSLTKKQKIHRVERKVEF